MGEARSLKFYMLDRFVLGIIGLILIYSAIILTAAYISGADIGEWIWNRHQNQFSWYSRPLFIIPAAYYAYNHKLWHVAGFMMLLATSLFWFDAPSTVSPVVSKYLEWEKQLFFTNSSKFPLIALACSVIVFLFLFFYAFWKRSLWWGLALINLGTLLKVIVSVTLGQEAGMAAIVPSISSLLIINLVAFFIWRHKRMKMK